MNESEKADQLIKFKPLIKSLARKLSKLDNDIYDDLVIVGEMSCLKFLDLFDKSRNTKLSTFLYSKIEGAMKDELKTKYNFFGRKSTDQPVPLSEVENIVSYDIEEFIIKKGENSKLKKLLESFPDKERKILYFKYWEDCTFAEIADKMGMKESRVSQIHRKVIKKLKKKIKNEIYI